MESDAPPGAGSANRPGALSHWLGRVADALFWLGCLATFLMMVHVAADVVFKLVLNAPLAGTLEMVTFYYMVAVVFLPLVIVQRRRGQIIVELFTHVLPPRALSALDAVVSVVGAAFVALLAYRCGLEAASATASGETTNAAHFTAPIWPARWFIVVSAAFMSIYLLVQGLADLVYAVTGRKARFDERADPAAHEMTELKEAL